MDNYLDSQVQHIKREEEEQITKVEAEDFGLPYVNLVNFPVTPDVLTIVPEDQALAHKVVAFDKKGDLVKVASRNPENTSLQKFLADLSNSVRKEIHLYYCSETSIKYALALYKTLVPEASKSDKVEIGIQDKERLESQVGNLQVLQEEISKVSTTELLDILFAGAVKIDATDIHFEPEEQIFRIRYRIDGVLQEVASLPSASYHQVIARIKYLSRLKLDVTKPQDGRFTISIFGEEIDIRVATLPASFGEAVVMRLLPKKKSLVSLDGLGFRSETMADISEAISKPQGLVLVTGPTGSGKTTTLYAILQKLNQPGRKIISLENPIEYRVSGIEQIQIDDNSKTSFLDALKGTLRQDPDVLMVGEIRDAETANIALQAAMTGHLVLSTLHTNNAPATLARLTEMGVEPYLLAGSINLIVGQRLVRKIHPVCQGKGCTECHQGYKGRIAIVETLVPNAEIEELILKKAPLRTFEETAHKLGMKTMYEDGMERVAQGITTKEEVDRVTKE